LHYAPSTTSTYKWQDAAMFHMPLTRDAFVMNDAGNDSARRTHSPTSCS